MSPITQKRGAFARAQKRGVGGHPKGAVFSGKMRFSTVNTPRNRAGKGANDASFIANNAVSCGFRRKTDRQRPQGTATEFPSIHSGCSLRQIALFGAVPTQGDSLEWSTAHSTRFDHMAAEKALALVVRGTDWSET